MTRSRAPEIGMEEGVRDRTIAARALAEDAAPSGAAAAEAILDERHRFLEQEIRPAARASAVDVLVAAELGETVRKGHDNRRHGARADQPVEPLGDILGKVLPVRMRGSTGGESHEIDEQWQPVGLCTTRNVDIDDACRRIAQQIVAQDAAVDRQAMDRARRGGSVASHIARVAFTSHARVSLSTTGESVSRTR